MIGLVKRILRRFRFRSSVTGRWVTPDYAKANPSTTTREKVREPR
jgi:hypothetical protein